MNPGGGSGWDEPPLDIQIPDDARELDRDVLAYHRELRAKRRRNLLRRLAGPFAGRGSVMPLLASILAVCLVAGAMLSVATFSPAITPADEDDARADGDGHASRAAVKHHGPALRGQPSLPAGPATRRAPQPRQPGRAFPAVLPDSAQPEPRVNPRRHDRYDFLPSDGT